MAAIRPLPDVDAHILEQLITGYTSAEIYQVTRDETSDAVHFAVRLTPLARPFVKRYPSLDQATIEHYRKLATCGHAFGALWMRCALASRSASRGSGMPASSCSSSTSRQHITSGALAARC